MHLLLCHIYFPKQRNMATSAHGEEALLFSLQSGEVKTCSVDKIGDQHCLINVYAYGVSPFILFLRFGYKRTHQSVCCYISMCRLVWNRKEHISLRKYLKSLVWDIRINLWLLWFYLIRNLVLPTSWGEAHVLLVVHSLFGVVEL